MKKWTYVSYFIFAAIFFSSQAHTATLSFDSDGQILGIKNVDLQTNAGLFKFDIDFFDGTCVDLVDGCEQYSNVFNFNLTQNLSASIINELGVFTDTPELINGCELTSLCNIFVPQQTFCCGETVAGLRVEIHEGSDNDLGFGGFVGMTRTRDLGLDNDSTYAVLSPSPVPVPAALWLFGSGLLALIGMARRKAA